MDLNGKTVGFFDLSKPHGHELCFRLKFLPEINPTNINDWINKFLNLKSFL